MSKKIIFIGIGLVLLLLLGAGAFFFLGQSKQQTGSNQDTPNSFSFWPFGNNVPSGEVPNENNTNTTGNNAQPAVFNPKAVVRKLSKDQVTGAGFIEKKEGVVVRFIEKINGHIYETELFSPKETRISNETMQASYKALWSESGNNVLLQYLEENNEIISTRGLSIRSIATSSEATSTIASFDFPIQIKQPVVAGESMFYLLETQNGSTGYTNDFSNKKSKVVWTTPLKELLTQFINNKTVVIQTKPAQYIKGYAYALNLDNGQIKKIVGDIPGLSISVSPNGENSIYIAQKDNVEMFFKTKATTTPVYPETFPEKCVWSKKDQSVVYCAVPKKTIDGTSLTNWYLGTESFSDSIWKYDLKNNISVILVNLKEQSGQDIDVTSISLSPKEEYILFLNKKDKSLWSVSLLNAESSNN